MGRNEGSKTIKPTIKRLIVGEALSSHKPRRALAVELIDEIERMGEIVPSEETIERLISYTRNHELDPQDKLWSVLSIANYNIQPEVLPTVLRLQAITLKEQKPITIREALWVSRLYYVFKNVTLHDGSGRVPDVEKELLLLEARQYALEERKLRILADKFPDKEETEKWLQRYGDAILYYFATGDLETVETTGKELIKRNILTEKEFAQWLTLAQQTRKQGRSKNERLNKATNT